MLERINFDPIDPRSTLTFDMHYHTEYSFDSNTKIKDIIKRAKRLGLNLAITDHNEIAGNLKAQKNRLGVKVIPAIEITFNEHRDLIFYFYNSKDMEQFYLKQIKPFKRSRSNMISKSAITFLEEYEPDDNILLDMPHPFSYGPKNFYNLMKRNKTKMKLLKKVNSFEIINSTLPKSANIKAISWAYHLDKSITGGSDGHILDQLGKVVTYTYGDNMLESIRKNRNYVGGIASSTIQKLNYMEQYLSSYVSMKFKGIGSELKSNINHRVNDMESYKMIRNRISNIKQAVGKRK